MSNQLAPSPSTAPAVPGYLELKFYAYLFTTPVGAFPLVAVMLYADLAAGGKYQIRSTNDGVNYVNVGPELDVALDQRTVFTISPGGPGFAVYRLA